MADTFTNKVKRGVKLLDAEVPNWRDRVDVDRLEMERTDRCVLGQVFGSYVDGLTKLGLNGGDRHGFSAGPSVVARYRVLDQKWRAVLS